MAKVTQAQARKIVKLVAEAVNVRWTENVSEWRAGEAIWLKGYAGEPWTIVLEGTGVSAIEAENAVYESIRKEPVWLEPINDSEIAIYPR